MLGAIVLICSVVVNRGGQTHRHMPFPSFADFSKYLKVAKSKIYAIFENKLSQLFSETQRNIYYKRHL